MRHTGLAARYLLGESHHPGGIASSSHLLDRCDPDREHDLVDVACGTGVSAVIAARRKATVLAYDLDPAAVAYAQKTLRRTKLADRVTVEVADAYDLPAAADSADVVICETGLSSFTDPALAVREMTRVVRPGGRVGIADVTWQEHRLAPHLREALLRLGTPRPIDEVTAMLVGAGLQIEVVEDRTTDARQLALRLEEKLWFAKKTRQLVRDALTAIDGGALSYTMWIAVKPSMGAR